MPEQSPLSATAPRWQALEFSLVVVMLGVLTLIVLLILLSPQQIDWLANASADLTPQQLLEQHKAMLSYRKDILSVVLTAFGAWIGAGAAYFFGRENLREAAHSLLQMSSDSPVDRLRQMRVGDIPPRPIDWTVKRADKLGAVVDKLRSDNARWYVPVVGANGELIDVIHKEGVWRFLTDDLANAQTKYTNATVDDLLGFFDKAGNESLKKQFRGVYVAVKGEASVATVNDELSKKNVYLAIVTDDSNRPVQYFDTGDVRRLLLR